MLSESKIQTRKQEIVKQLMNTPQKPQRRKEKNSGPPIFITKTYQILENQEYKDVASWNEDGTNFVIMDVDRFQQQVLPIYFRHRNFSSFVRQLNMYDFHKIRNELNRSIFEHKQFRRHHKQSLRNIKRKNCGNNGPGKDRKENDRDLQNEDVMSISDPEEMLFGNEESLKYQDKYQRTIESIEKICHDSPMTSIRIIHAPMSPTPEKKKIMEEFINSLPEIIESEQEVHNKINDLKNDPKYECLNTKKDIRKLIYKIRRKIPKRDDDYLEELSIQEEIIVDKIQRDTGKQGTDPTLDALSTDMFLLPKSLNLIGSMNFCEDVEHLFFQTLY